MMFRCKQIKPPPLMMCSLNETDDALTRLNPWARCRVAGFSLRSANGDAQIANTGYDDGTPGGTMGLQWYARTARIDPSFGLATTALLGLWRWPNPLTAACVLACSGPLSIKQSRCWSRLAGTTAVVAACSRRCEPRFRLLRSSCFLPCSWLERLLTHSCCLAPAGGSSALTVGNNATHSVVNVASFHAFACLCLAQRPSPTSAISCRKWRSCSIAPVSHSPRASASLAALAAQLSALAALLIARKLLLLLADAAVRLHTCTVRVSWNISEIDDRGLPLTELYVQK
jgi:hypothetical protein